MAYFDGKGLRPGFSWQDVWGEEHAYGFTVAKATDVELLTIFRDSIQNALKTGQGFETWKKDVLGQLGRAGWTRPRMVSDPTGQDPDRMVNFASSRRLKTIFWSNVNSARAAGQWQRAQRTKGALPYLLYVRTTSLDPRPEHLTWVGIILPIDDPFWITHFPPNGWLCKCQVRQISAREAAQLLGREPDDGGLVYRDTAPDLGPDVPFRNRRTGEITMVPAGIDPGWQTNSGLARGRTLIDAFADRLDTAAPADALKVLAELWQDPFLRLAPKLKDTTWLPAGVSPQLAESLSAVRSPVVSIPSDVIADRLARHAMSMDEFALLPRIIQDGTLLADPRGDAAVRLIVARFGKNWWRAFVKLSASGYLRVNSLHQLRQKVAVRILEDAGLSLDDIPDLARREGE
jgi:hypothetical protein